MNPDVQGSFYLSNMTQFLEEYESLNYNLVIFAGLTDSQASIASKRLWKSETPCIFITVVGFFFHIRLQKQIHFVESSNTNSKKYYLRLADPFPELEKYAFTHNVHELVQAVSKTESF